MTPTQAHQRLDALGALNDAHGAGTYALTVAAPDAVDAVQRRWLNAIDAPLPDAYAEQLAAADRTLYVGRSGDVYARIMEHAKSDVRKSTFVSVFKLSGIHGVWPGDNGVVAERKRARTLSSPSTICWYDGEIL